MIRSLLSLLIVGFLGTTSALRGEPAPSSAPRRPRILGISHAAFYVSDLARARAFYKSYLGFGEPFSIPWKENGELVWIKINDRQTVELFHSPDVPLGSERLFHVAIEVDDAEAMRVYLRSRGVEVPAHTGIGKIGNKNYFVKDPHGNIVEITEYLPGGWTRREQGKHLPETRIATRMSHVGVLIGQLDQALEFYTGILGFKETWRGSAGGKALNWVNLQVPEGDDYLELMLYETVPSTERLLTMQHICLEVPDVAKAAETLRTRSAPAGLKPVTAVKTGVNGKRQINAYDPDGTRVEIMEPGTWDGKSVPSSLAPPPRTDSKG